MIRVYTGLHYSTVTVKKKVIYTIYIYIDIFFQMLNKYCYRSTNHILKHGLCIHNNNTMTKISNYNKVVY